MEIGILTAMLPPFAPWLEAGCGHLPRRAAVFWDSCDLILPLTPLPLLPGCHDPRQVTASKATVRAAMRLSRSVRRHGCPPREAASSRLPTLSSVRYPCDDLSRCVHWWWLVIGKIGALLEPCRCMTRLPPEFVRYRTARSVETRLTGYRSCLTSYVSAAWSCPRSQLSVSCCLAAARSEPH